MKKILSIALMAVLMAGINNLYAQQREASISWDKTVHDFGKFKEESGKQTCTYTFTNTGSQPLIITNVRASCGCTSPTWTKEPVKAGEKGYVKATYNPRNRPGRFNKSVTVTTNATPPTTILRLKGDVTPREKTIEDYYPKVFDDIRLKSSHLAFVKISNTETRTDSIGVVNMADKPVTLDFSNVPDHISITAIPKTLKGKKGNAKHGQKGIIMVTYNAKEKNDWGFVIDRIYLLLNGEKNYRNRLSVSATIQEDFSHLTPKELANAPKIKFEDTEYDFGTIKQKEKASTKYVFENTGKSDLIIRKIRASCGCTATKPEKSVIKPGEKSHIDVTFNSAGKRGKQRKTITVITNDPKNSTTRLRIKGTVQN